jgi:hypothetical protein
MTKYWARGLTPPIWPTRQHKLRRRIGFDRRATTAEDYLHALIELVKDAM